MPEFYGAHFKQLEVCGISPLGVAPAPAPMPALVPAPGPEAVVVVVAQSPAESAVVVAEPPAPPPSSGSDGKSIMLTGVTAVAGVFAAAMLF